MTNQYYSNAHVRLDTVMGNSPQMRQVMRLRLAQQEYNLLNHDSDQFASYLLEHYGIQLLINDEGLINPNYEVVDQHKHMIFLLKFSQ
jgi:hypothetical protein